MKRSEWRRIMPLLAISFALLLQACAAGTRLLTASAEPSRVQGTYSLYLYGCRYPADIQNMAFLVPEGSPYKFEIYDLPTSYKVKQGLPGPQAVQEAKAFVQCSNHRVNEEQLKQVLDNTGRPLAYEVRPLYFPLEFGQMDVMLVDYTLLKDNTIRTHIRLDPDVQRALESSGSDRNHRER